MDKVFVSKADYISKIKNLNLQKVMKIGSCLDTPLEKRATFDYECANVNGQSFVTVVYFFHPGHVSPTEIFEVMIPLSDWYQMTLPVGNFEDFQYEVNKRANTLSIVKAFEEAAKIHGARQAAVANGFISEPEPFLRESGKILKDARDALIKELE